MPTMSNRSLKSLRRQLDDLGYFQALVPESVPLVEALLHDLLATTHNLKQCKEQRGHQLEASAPPAAASSAPSAHRDPPQLNGSAASRVVLELQVKVNNLEQLNQECMATIRKLQLEIEERSKKILKLELANNRAKVMTQREKPYLIESGQPKIEMTALLESRPRAQSSPPPKVAEGLNVITLYEERNKQLQSQLHRLQSELDDARLLLARVQSGLTHRDADESSNDKLQSDYVVKLAQENAALRSQLQQKCAAPSRGHCCTSFCNQTGAEHATHIQMHNRCLQDQLAKLVENGAQEQSLKDQHSEIQKLRAEIQHSQEENAELERRIRDLVQSSGGLRDKVRRLEEKQSILLSSACPGTRVDQLIRHIEAQRDVYRHNVEQLLDSLDPKRRRIPTRQAAGAPDSATPEAKIPSHAKVILDSCRQNSLSNDAVTVTKYVDHAEVEMLKEELRRLRSENSEHLSEVNRLKDQVAMLETQVGSSQRHTSEKVSELRDEHNVAWKRHQDHVHALESEIQGLREAQKQAETRLHKLSLERDRLHADLDDKTEEIDRLRTEQRDAAAKALEADKSMRIMEQRLNDLRLLEQKVGELERDKTTLLQRAEAERSLYRELKQEHLTLKAEAAKWSQSAATSEQQVGDLRSHVQKYVNEVKRAEELLSLRDKERSELLDQYKHLADEAESFESYGRKLEMQVAKLQMELSSKTAELRASEVRLTNMEQDLVEISLANEKYRSEVATLTTKIDIAESELRAARTHSDWISSDMTEVHQMAEQLNLQKLELQQRLREQNEEIESLKHQIRLLNQRVAQLLQPELHSDSEAKTDGGSGRHQDSSDGSARKR